MQKTKCIIRGCSFIRDPILLTKCMEICLDSSSRDWLWVRRYPCTASELGTQTQPRYRIEFNLGFRERRGCGSQRKNSLVNNCRLIHPDDHDICSAKVLFGRNIVQWNKNKNTILMYSAYMILIAYIIISKKIKKFCLRRIIKKIITDKRI